MDSIIIDQDKLRELVNKKAGLISKKEVAKSMGMYYPNFVRWYNGKNVGLEQLKTINRWVSEKD